jgi:response regulator NasT
MPLSMLLIDGDALRSAMVGGALREAGYDVAMIAKETTRVRTKIAESRPDMIVDLEASDRTRLNDLASLSQSIGWPMAVRLEHARQRPADAVMDPSVSIYAVERLGEQDVRSILDLTMDQLDLYARLTLDLDEMRSEVNDRKTIARARNILMAVKALTREEADRLLLQVAIKQNRETFEVAQDLVRAIDQFDDESVRASS